MAKRQIPVWLAQALKSFEAIKTVLATRTPLISEAPMSSQHEQDPMPPESLAVPAPVGEQQAPAPAPVAVAPLPTRDLWRAIVDATPDAVIVLDRTGAVCHHNALAQEMFPRLRTGLLLSQVARHPDLIEATDRAEEVTGPIEIQIIDHVPIERRISTRVTRLAGRGEASNEPWLLLNFRDLSEQDRLTQMRADFVANASHELRTPLASLRGYIETLQGAARNDPNARDRFLSSMADQASRMTRLIDDLLSLSRIEMRQHLPPRQVIDLNAVVLSSVQMMEPLASSAKVSLRSELVSGSALIRGDRDEIVQVLQNLIHNAIKYGREGGRVSVRMVREAGSRHNSTRLAVEVTDDGAGIAPEHLPRLTERFYRVSVASSRDKGGTGLGLAIVKHVMNRHRGELRIASKVGRGSTFTVVFEQASDSQPS